MDAVDWNSHNAIPINVHRRKQMKVLFDLPSGRIAIEGDGPELLKILQAARELAPHVTQIQITSTAAEIAPQYSEEPQRTSSTSNGGGDLSSMTMRPICTKSCPRQCVRKDPRQHLFLGTRLKVSHRSRPKKWTGGSRCAASKSRRKCLWRYSTPRENIAMQKALAGEAGAFQTRARI